MNKLSESATTISVKPAIRQAITAARRVLALGFSLALMSCGGEVDSVDDISVSATAGDEDLSTSKVYASGPHAIHLVPCALAETTEEACSLAAVPIIGMETTSPTSDDIATRLVVSHDWMGDRFIELIEHNAFPDDIKLLLRSVTAIVIHSEIRPSYYWGLTGAIYLDPSNLWLTAAEEATISDKDDFRSGFDDELSFISLWRYVDNDQLIASSNSDDTRNLEHLIFPVAELLFHELAHANDFLPPTTHASLDPADKVFEAINKVSDNVSTSLVAEDLQQSYPLTSSIMIDLAQVMFRGETATEIQKSYPADGVGLAFSQDSANDDYGFNRSSSGLFHEDVAMLFEELMVKYHFDIDRQIGFTTQTVENSPYCNDYLIGWGQINRIGDPLVKERARLVAAKLLPSRDLTSFINQLPAPRQTENGKDWCYPVFSPRAARGTEENRIRFDLEKDRRKRH